MLSLDKREGEGKGEGVRGEGRSVQYYDIMIERVCGVSHVKDVIWREREKGCVVREERGTISLRCTQQSKTSGHHN